VRAKDLEIDARKVKKSQNIVEYDLSVKGNSIHATEFSNDLENDDTKNSNSNEIHDIELNTINISSGRALEHKNFNISSEIRLL
jgi:hypothetical protein